MRFLLSLFLSLTLANAEEYVPGTPGSPWTKEEVLIVKSKLYSIFHSWGGGYALIDIHGQEAYDNDYTWQDIPDEGKVLRLGFHDCLKYEDGTGGCDGCLNWEGVGYRYPEEATHKFMYPDIGKTNNNGMGPTVEVLEHIYTDTHFPKGHAPSLNVSLKASGKSRADLWALATIAAVEYSIETNNMVCDGTYNDNPEPQCNMDAGSPDCRVELPRPIKFKTGRRDCSQHGDETYKATKHESHPNAVGNGKMTAEFFANNFGFSGRESVAILGAHTVGRLHYGISLFRYVWTTKGTRLFNNHYYKNIVREPKVAIEDNECRHLTDAEGNVPKTRWVVKVRGDTYIGGPVHWVHENYRCPNCHFWPEDPCCQNVPDGQFCKSDSLEFKDDPNENGGCEAFHFISGIDEMAIPSEIGLYFDFEVTEDGVPYGCPGFETFTPENWNTTNYGFTWSCLPNQENPDPNNPWHWKKADPDCPLNTMQIPKGSTPLHQIFEEYAADQQKWVNDFIPTLEKMLSNGYQDNDLVDAPDQYTGIHCQRQEVNDHSNYYNCIDTDELDQSEAFFLISRLHGRAIEGKPNGYGKVMSFDSNDQKQKWMEAKIGNQFINVATGLPLFAGSGRAWTFAGKELRIIDPLYGKAIWVPWANVDGGDIGSSIPDPSWKNPTQMFVKLTTKEFQAPLEGPRIKIQSALDGRVIEGKPNGDGIMNTSNENNQNQLWVRKEAKNGIQFINVGTKLPLMIQDVSVWTYTDQRTIEDADNLGMGIYRGWGEVDGQTIGIYKLWYGSIFWFDLIE